MLKRNDLCHCGSGKKYKNCCMEKDKSGRVDELNKKALLDRKDKIDRNYTATIVKLGHHLEELIDKDENFAKMEGESRNNLFGDMLTSNIASNRFFASYFSYDYMIDRDTTPAIYTVNHFRFNQDEKNIVYSCVNSYPSLFTIDKIDDIEVVIKDMFTGHKYKTLDSKILGNFAIGDYILGRPVRIGDIYVLIDLTIRIQEETKNMIYDAIMKAFEENKDKIGNLEYFVAMNSLFFYKYMLQLLQISDYKDNELEETLESIEDQEDKVATLESSKVVREGQNEDTLNLDHIFKEKIKDEEIYKGIMRLWIDIADKINIGGSENGWAAGLEYYYKKQNDIAATQSAIAKEYGVSTSTLAKRNKEISAVFSD